MYRSQIAFLTAVVAVVLASGCGKSTVADDAVANDIKAKLYSDPVTKPANIDVSVKGGVATLGGEVPSSDVQQEALKLANAATGVTSVADQLKVTAAANSMPPNAVPPPAALAPTPTAPTPEAERRAEPRRESAGNDAGPGPARVDAPRAPEERVETATIPAGDRVSVRTIDAIDSKVNTEGQTFRASLDSPLVLRDRVVVTAGAPVSILLTSARAAGRIKGSSEMEVRLASLEYKGRSYPVNSSVVAEQGKARGKQTAVKTGIGAAAGAIIGAIAGGGKGAAIGSAAGGGAGFGYSVLTHGPQVKIPSETVLTFRLEAPLVLTTRR
jgi:hypothetical protein